MHNIITLTDSYKLTHWKQYPEGTQHVYSYFESRKGARFDETVFFGLQYVLKEYLEGAVVTEDKIAAADRLARAHFNGDLFNAAGWRHVLERHGGRLPVRIRAVPEGTRVPTGNVLMTVENTDPACWWLTNYLETILTHVWYPSTVATLSAHVKSMIKSYLKYTGGPMGGLPFMLHDFGFRGASSVESAGIGGAAHLVNFVGTDTVRAIEVAMEYYGAGVCGFSVPATEHSVMTAMGPDGEQKVFEHMIDQYPGGILSVVSDSYDIFGACERIIGTALKDKILRRDGVFVVRPDSGDPVPTVLRILAILGDKFGHGENAAGYKVLNPKVRVIWGDGLEPDTIGEILKCMAGAGWGAENIVFGMGGGLLQKVNRDTQRFAFKSSAQCRGGVWHDIFKKPKDESKTSKKGRLSLIRVEGAHGSQYMTVPEADANDELYLKHMRSGGDELKTVFEDGRITSPQTFDQVRERAGF